MIMKKTFAIALAAAALFAGAFPQAAAAQSPRWPHVGYGGRNLVPDFVMGALMDAPEFAGAGSASVAELGLPRARVAAHAMALLDIYRQLNAFVLGRIGGGVPDAGFWARVFSGESIALARLSEGGERSYLNLFGAVAHGVSVVSAGYSRGSYRVAARLSRDNPLPPARLRDALPYIAPPDAPLIMPEDGIRTSIGIARMPCAETSQMTAQILAKRGVASAFEIGEFMAVYFMGLNVPRTSSSEVSMADFEYALRGASVEEAGYAGGSHWARVSLSSGRFLPLEASVDSMDMRMFERLATDEELERLFAPRE